MLCAPLKTPMNEHTKQVPQALLPARSPHNIAPCRLLLPTESNFFVLKGPVCVYRSGVGNFKRAAKSGVVALEQGNVPSAAIANVLQRMSVSHMGVWWSSSIS